MIKKKILVVVTCLTLALSSLTASAASYTNSKSFSKVVLPELSGNTTLASTSAKATNKDYGKVKITSYVNCSAVSCWFRTKDSSGSYHYWLPYIVTINDKAYHKMYYSNSSLAYYIKGIKAEVRAENATEALTIKSEKVSGSVYFN